jgi:hypothetical protein
MNEKTPHDHNKSKGRPRQPDRAAVAARDPGPGSKNRPGFDLGGATGESDPRNPTAQVQDAVEGASRNTVRGHKATGKMKSAVAGVRNWLRRE